MDTLPGYFDVVVVGTGVTESIVSAAAARQGHSVLHIDPRDYYGGKWATLPWNDWDAGDFARIPPTLSFHDNRIGTFRRLSGDEDTLHWKNDIRELESHWYTNDDTVKTEVKSLNRRFNIDVVPKVLMAREEIIELLIKSNVSRYLEFTCINRLLATLPPPNHGLIEPIPLSRSDIFTTKTISLVEKRRLMKFLEFVLKADEESTIPTRKSFAELAERHQLSGKVSHLLQSAVRTMDDSLQLGEWNDDFNLRFTENCRLFLQSINRYGNQTPFLWTLYGVSEICQSFCRLSAIYGGTFILKRGFQSVSEIEEDGQTLLEVETEGVNVRTTFLVLCPEIKVERRGCARTKSPKCIQGITLVRAVLLVKGPKLKEEAVEDVGEPEESSNSKKLAIYRFGDMDVIELDETSLATPKNFRMLQVSLPHHEGYSSPRETVEARLRPYVIFDDTTAAGSDEATCSTSTASSAPRVLYATYFLADFYDDIRDEDDQHPNIFHCNSASTELKEHVDKGREIFQKMYADEAFLPPAPEQPPDRGDLDLEMDDDDCDDDRGTVDYRSSNGFPD